MSKNLFVELQVFLSKPSSPSMLLCWDSKQVGMFTRVFPSLPWRRAGCSPYNYN